MTAKVLEALAIKTHAPSRSTDTLASTNTRFLPVRNTSARQIRIGPSAGRKNVTLFSTVITSLSSGHGRRGCAAASVIRDCHQYAGVNEPMLLFDDRSCRELCLAPTESEGTQLNPQRADESRVLKNVLNEAPVGVCHSLGADASEFAIPNLREQARMQTRPPARACCKLSDRANSVSKRHAVS